MEMPTTSISGAQVVRGLTGEKGVSDKPATAMKYRLATRRNCS